MREWHRVGLGLASPKTAFLFGGCDGSRRIILASLMMVIESNSNPGAAVKTLGKYSYGGFIM